MDQAAGCSHGGSGSNQSRKRKRKNKAKNSEVKKSRVDQISKAELRAILACANKIQIPEVSKPTAIVQPFSNNGFELIYLSSDGEN